MATKTIVVPTSIMETKGRPQISVTRIEGTSKIRAEIPEKWGKRIIIADVEDRSQVAEGYFLVSYQIFNVHNDGRIDKSIYRHPTFNFHDMKPGTELEVIGKHINEYFNHRYRLMRILRMD